MAQHVRVLLIDDLNGGDADETISFSVDGTDYEIDLCKQNADVLRETLGEFTAVARKTRQHRKVAGPRGTTKVTVVPMDHGMSGTQRREHLKRVKDWLTAQGHEFKDRGRLPQDLVAKYEAAHSGAQPPLFQS